jgi:hypothetical protein
VIKQRSITWIGRVALIGKMKNAYTFKARISEGKRNLGKYGVDGTITSE